jgi:restriction endonuclease S subunit
VIARDLSHAYDSLQIAEVLSEAGRADDALEWAQRGLIAFADERHGHDPRLDVVGVVCDESIALPEYLELFIRTTRRDLAAFAPATTQANINLAILSEVAVAVPPINEQCEIVRVLFNRASRTLLATRAAAHRVERISEAFLAKALSGELSVIGSG